MEGHWNFQVEGGGEVVGEGGTEWGQASKEKKHQVKMIEMGELGSKETVFCIWESETKIYYQP